MMTILFFHRQHHHPLINLKDNLLMTGKEVKVVSQREVEASIDIYCKDRSSLESTSSSSSASSLSKEGSSSSSPLDKF